MDLPESAQPLPDEQGPELIRGDREQFRDPSESHADPQPETESASAESPASKEASGNGSGGREPNGSVADAERYGRVLFGDLHGTWIEVRVITEKNQTTPREKSRVVARRFYDSLSAQLAALPELMLLGEHERAGVFIGVLPRREKNKGKAIDTASGRVAWIDIDFKDFQGGEEEARALLAKFGLQPTLIVRSGHGIHCYWLLTETLRSADLADLSKLLAAALGGDHAFDAARLLRLPGTYNRKDPSAPILTTIELLDPERVCTAEALRAAARDALPPADESDPGNDEDFDDSAVGEDQDLPGNLPASILALISLRKSIRGLFHGEGKTEAGPDGKRTDTSSSGYDWSFALAVARAGITNVAEIATAILCRPDGGARRKGTDYANRTATKAVAFLQKARQEVIELALDFKVQSFRVYDSNPPRFEMTVEGVTFLLSSRQLRSPGAFADAFLCALRRIPSVPRKLDEWTPVVNALLKDAVRVSMPPEASDEPTLRDDIERILLDLPVGEVTEDLQHGKVVLLADGRRAFKVEAIQKRLKDEGRDVLRQDICRHLHDMGYDSAPERIGGTPVRVWRRNAATP
jgi:hypothetical protein